jgi:restriction system protein
VSIPDFQTLMLPALRLASVGELRVSDAVDRLANDFKLSPEDRSHLLPSGRQTTFANRIHWAKSYLGKAGLVESTRCAHFRITDRGREVLGIRPTGSISSSSADSRFPEILGDGGRR